MLAVSAPKTADRLLPMESAVTQPPTSVRGEVSDASEQERLSFGMYLTRAREARGLSLDDLAHQTKIRRAILEALEHNARRDLPEKVFVLGYVRSFANAVGLSAEEAIQRCNADWDIIEDVAPSENVVVSRRSWAWLWPTLAAAGFGGGIWFIVHLH